MKTHLDSVIANVRDLKAVLANLEKATGLKPFHISQIPIQGRDYSLALVMLGQTSLEFIECGQLTPPVGIARVREVTLCAPQVKAEQTLWLEEGLKLVCLPGDKPLVLEAVLDSCDPAGDAEILTRVFDLERKDLAEQRGVQLCTEGACLRLLPPEADWQPTVVDDRVHFIHGWRRVAFSVKDLDAAIHQLGKAGAEIAVPRFQVMPGLEEAMLRLPSDIVIQPVYQNLPRLLLGLFWQNITSIFTGRKKGVQSE